MDNLRKKKGLVVELSHYTSTRKQVVKLGLILKSSMFSILSFSGIYLPFSITK